MKISLSTKSLFLTLICIFIVSCESANDNKLNEFFKDENTSDPKHESRHLEGSIVNTSTGETLYYQIEDNPEDIKATIEIKDKNNCNRYHSIFVKSDIDLTSQNSPDLYFGEKKSNIALFWKSYENNTNPYKFDNLYDHLIQYKHFIVQKNERLQKQDCKLKPINNNHILSNDVIINKIRKISLSAEAFNDTPPDDLQIPNALNYGSHHLSVSLENSDDTRIIINISNDNKISFSGISYSVDDSINLPRYKVGYIQYSKKRFISLSTSLPLLLSDADIHAHINYSFCMNPRIQNVKSYYPKNEMKRLEKELLNKIQTCKDEYESRSY